MSSAIDQHAAEVADGERFEFGKNWARFLAHLNEARIKLAEDSLKQMLETERLDGLTFLDIGSGSGLFSLAARRLGAKVFSFDFDPHSVACTRELRSRYFPDSSDWTVETGSVLDSNYLQGLGQFDVVYSWGVLHHTGKMHDALSNVKPLAKPGGRLFIAIYNDMGEETDTWAKIKQRYNALPGPLALLYALTIIGRKESRTLLSYVRQRQPLKYFRTWTDYAKTSTRGMSRWHDWIDWIGGHPYERASVEQMVDFFGKDGFRLIKLVDRSNGYGCNEFVFRREAALGTAIHVRIPGGKSVLRRFGWRMTGPMVTTPEGVFGPIPPALRGHADELLLFRDGRLVGPAVVKNGQIKVAESGIPPARLDAEALHVVAGRIVLPAKAFVRIRRKMWGWEVPKLEPLADNARSDGRSPVFVFEQGLQLPDPHSLHAEIAKRGAGRFSHWGRWIYFAPRNNGDPNAMAADYRLVVCTEISETPGSDA